MHPSYDALEGRKENSPGQVKRSPGLGTDKEESPGRARGKKVLSQIFCRPAGLFRSAPLPRAALRLPGATLLPPPGDLEFGHLDAIALTT